MTELNPSNMRGLSSDERKAVINNAFGAMDKDGSNSVSIEEIVDYILLNGRFDLGTKSQRDFSTAVLRKLGNDHMNRTEFEVISPQLSILRKQIQHFWLDFYQKFFKMDTNGDQFVSVMETIAYFDAHDLESFRQAGAYLKNADLNLDGRMSILEFFISFPDLESILDA